MAEINLDDWNYSKETNKYKVTGKSETYNNSDLFKKVTFEIEYKTTYSYWFNARPFYVYIKETASDNIFFSYYTYDDKHILNAIEAYFSVLYSKIPLIIGFKRKDGTQYYTHTSLKDEKQSYGFPLKNHFKDDELEEKLKGENDKRNKIRFSTDTNKSQNHKSKVTPYENYLKCQYTVDKSIFKGSNELSAQEIFKVENRNNVTNSDFENVNNKQFDFIDVYYTHSNIILLVEFKGDSSGINIGKNYCFKRVDKDGKKWSKVEENEDSKEENKKKLLDEVFYSITKSILIVANKISDEYSVKLVENSEINTVFTSSTLLTSTKIQVKKPDGLSRDKYKLIYHDLSNVTKSIGDVKNPDITGLRLFIVGNTNDISNDTNNIEIKLYDNQGIKHEHLLYKARPGQVTGHTVENDEFEDKVYVYFYDSDNIPLLVFHNRRWFAPKSKDEYLSKWVEELSLRFYKPSDKTSSEILTKLKEINKGLNEIKIGSINDGYGIIKQDKQNGKEYFILGQVQGKRVNVERKQSEYFIKVTHSTKNNSAIGKIMYNGKQLHDESNKVFTDSSTTYNQVSVYYHLLDESCKISLLLGMSTSGKSTVYYERANKSDNFKWNKVINSSSFTQDPLLAEKINDIHYKFNKSIAIQLEIQGNEYNLKTVGNQDSLASPLSDGNSKIMVSQDCTDLNESQYKCYKHSFSEFISSTKQEEIGGLRLFIFNTEIMIYSSNVGSVKSSIYYKKQDYSVFVYFYDCSILPMMVKYNNKFYKTVNKNEYFRKWTILSYTSISPNVKSELDKINKSLNEIDIYQKRNNSFYGISKPDKGGEELDGNFLNRVSVKVCKNQCYRKITHSTLNKFYISEVKDNNKRIILIDESIECNKICVYYQTSDRFCLMPLLISVEFDSSPDPIKWYSRASIDGSKWDEYRENGKYNEDAKIQNQLNIIRSRLLIILTIRAEHNSYGYNIIATDGNCSSPNEFKQNISSSMIGSLDSINVKGYRFYSHSINHYYKDNKIKILNHFNLSKSDLTLELRISIFGQNVKLFDEKDEIILTYGDDECNRNKNIDVYFYNPSTQDTDTVPLLFKYKDNYFAPNDKNSYFIKWSKISKLKGILGVSASQEEIDKVTKELCRISDMFNEIEVKRKVDYGIPYCTNGHKKRAYYQSADSNTKRIKVSTYKNSGYIMTIHDPVNDYKIGNIRPINNFNFTEHSNHISKININQVVAIFKIGNFEIPELLLLNERTKYNVTTYCYYYKDTTRGVPLAYKFNHVKDGCKIISKLKGDDEDYDFFDHDMSDIKNLLSEIGANTMIIETPKLSESEEGNCVNEIDSDLEIEECTKITTSRLHEGKGLASPQGEGSLIGDGGSSTFSVSSSSTQGIPPVVENQELQAQGTRNEVSPEVRTSSHTSPSVKALSPKLPSQETSDGREPGPVSSHIPGPESGQSKQLDFDGKASSEQEDLPKTQDSRRDSTSESPVQDNEISQSPNGLGSKGESPINESIPPNTENSSIDSDSLGLENGDELSSSGGMTSRNGKRKVVEEPVPNPDDNTTEDKGVGEKIVKFLDDHKEAVGGGGGALVTVSGSAYPLYKVISKCATK